MGLFGGFKAKFSKDSVAKNVSKNSKKNDVVCLGYRVFSEFSDTLHQPHESSTTIKQSSSVEDKPQVNLNENTTNAQATAELQAPVIAKPKVKKHSKKITIETETSNGIAKEAENVEANEVPPNIELKSNKYNDAAYIEGKTSTFNPAPKSSNYNKKTAPKSILKAKPSSELREYNSTESENHLESLDNINNVGLNRDKAIVDRKGRSTSNETFATVKYSKSTKTTSGSLVSQVSTQLQKSESTYTNDTVSISTSVSQAKVSSLIQKRGISNTSNVAANLFFDDDDDYDDDEGANRRSVEC